MIITPPLLSEIQTHFSYVTSEKIGSVHKYITLFLLKILSAHINIQCCFLSQRFAWCQSRPRGGLGEAGAEARRAGEAARRPGLLEATLLLSPSTEEPVSNDMQSPA